jgi:hypothetical protein
MDPSSQSKGGQTASRAVLVADLQLLVASIMFGFGFVAQRGAMIDGLGPLTFNALRYVVSAVAMVVVMPILNRQKSKDEKVYQFYNILDNVNQYSHILSISNQLCNAFH